MAGKIYIFIFLLVYFGTIESNKAILRQNPGNITKPEFGPSLLNRTGIVNFACTYMEDPAGFSFLLADTGALVINEIMADPTPMAGLPDREYLELYNAGTTAVNLKGWSIGLGAKLKSFPDVTVSPGGYLLVSAPGGTRDLQQYGSVIEISGFLVNNDGLRISLYDPDKQLTDQVEYLPSLHKKGFEDGGFSLERIDPHRLCGQRSNWTTTLSAKGGTPGSENSVRAANPDSLPPQLLSTFFSDNTRLDIRLSESFSLPGASADYLKNIPVEVAIDSVKTDQFAGMIQIYFRPSTIRNGVNYSLSLHGIKDDCMNTMPDQAVKFGYYVPMKSDLLISEVLFNPYPEGADFVEIFNNSGHEVDLSGLSLATRGDSKELKQISQISNSQQYLPVGAYLATTKSREGILRFYSAKCEDCILQTEKFPTLADLSGCVVLLNKNLDVIDEMEYNDGMHHPFITQTEGISLERINFTEPASRKGNWHSASKSSGFATPGYQNSVEARADSSGNLVSIDPEIFSPNGDGIKDQLNIYINTGEPGWILNITILNCAGRVVRNLANNFMTGSSDQLLWDGLSDDFQKVQPGIYLLNISLFERTGKNQMKRFACVLTDHL